MMPVDTRDEIEAAFITTFGNPDGDRLIDDLLFRWFAVQYPADQPLQVEPQLHEVRDALLRLASRADVFLTADPIDPDSDIGSFVFGLLGVGQMICESKLAVVLGVSARAVFSALDEMPAPDDDETLDQRVLRFARLIESQTATPPTEGET